MSIKTQYEIGPITFDGGKIEKIVTRLEVESIDEIRAFAAQQAESLQNIALFLQDELPQAIRNVTTAVQEVVQTTGDDTADEVLNVIQQTFSQFGGNIQVTAPEAEQPAAQESTRLQPVKPVQPAQPVGLKAVEENKVGEVTKGIKLAPSGPFRGNFAGNTEIAAPKLQPVTDARQPSNVHCGHNSHYKQVGEY